MKQVGFPKGHTPWNKGGKLTNAHKGRISKSLRGKSSALKGTTRSEEVREKISENRRGKSPWNKGVPMSKSFKRKVAKGLERYHASRKDQ